MGGIDELFEDELFDDALLDDVLLDEEFAPVFELDKPELLDFELEELFEITLDGVLFLLELMLLEKTPLETVLLELILLKIVLLEPVLFDFVASIPLFRHEDKPAIITSVNSTYKI